jgi:drug/metabolite transporter (DMT)-like permease
MVAGACLLVVPYAISGQWRELSGVTAEGFAALAFLGLGCTGIAYLAWSAALKRLEAGTLTSFQYLQPLVTVAAASAWLGEPIGPIVLLGGALVLLGVFLVQRGAVPASGGSRP